MKKDIKLIMRTCLVDFSLFFFEVVIFITVHCCVFKSIIQTI